MVAVPYLVVVPCLGMGPDLLGRVGWRVEWEEWVGGLGWTAEWEEWFYELE